MGAMPIERLRPAVEISLQPGDWLVLLSDGVYEYEDPDGAPLGAAAVEALLAQAHCAAQASMSKRLLSSLQTFARGAPQEDDITMVLVKRLGAVTVL